MYGQAPDPVWSERENALTNTLAAAIDVRDAHWETAEGCAECGEPWPCFTERKLGSALSELLTQAEKNR